MAGQEHAGVDGIMPKLKGVVRVAVANIAVIVILLSAIEGYFRVTTANLSFFLFSEPRMRLDGRAFVTAHPSRGFVLLPGYEDDDILIDEQGFRAGRNDDLSAGTADLAVLTLGESTTFGWGVAQGHDYPSLLDLELENLTGRSVEVTNGGVPSYSSAQVAITLEELVEEGLSVDLVLVSVLWNDVYYSATPNWYPDLLVFQQPPTWRRVLFHHSATFRYLSRLRIDRLGEVDRPNPQALATFSANIERMLAVRGHGRVLFVEPPYCRDRLEASGMRGLGIRYSPGFLNARIEEYAARVREVASHNGSVVIDHRLSVLHRPRPELFLDSTHPTAEGNRLMAQDIAYGLVRAGLLEKRRAMGSQEGDTRLVVPEGPTVETIADSKGASK